MPQDDLLFTLAEVAVAFAGFAGLVTILSRREGRSSEQVGLDLRNLQSVLGASLVVVAFALLPPVLAHMGMSPELTWRTSAGVFFLVAGAYFLWAIPNARAIYRIANQRFHWTLWANFGLSGCVLLVLALCALSIAPPSYYLAAVCAYLYFAAAAFVRVFVSLGRNAPLV